MAEAPNPTNEEISMGPLQAAVSRYLNEGPGDKEPLKILTVGRGGIGKSTLINNMLRLDGVGKAQTEWSARPVTKGVQLFTCILEPGVPIHVYDTPGLEDRGIDSNEVVKEVKEQTKGSINVIFYVSSLFNRIDETDGEIIKALTNEFSPDIWKHTILVLSFANYRCNEEEYAQATSDTAAVFQEYLREQNGCEDMTVRCIRTQDHIEGTYDIPAIPIGKDRDGDPADWYPLLLILTFRSCDSKGKIQLVIATSPDPTALVGGVVGGVVGGAAASILGATTTATATALTTAAALDSVLLATPLYTSLASFGFLGPLYTLPTVSFAFTPTIPVAATMAAAPVAAPAAVVAVGAVAGLTVGVAVCYGIKKYVWPFLSSGDTK